MLKLQVASVLFLLFKNASNADRRLLIVVPPNEQHTDRQTVDGPARNSYRRMSGKVNSAAIAPEVFEAIIEASRVGSCEDLAKRRGRHGRQH